MTSSTGSMQTFGSAASPESSARGMTSAGLVLLYAPGFESMRPVYPLASEHVTLGRDPGVEVHVPEQAVSRRHARVSFRGGAWHVSDLGSSNGTIVDGRFISEETELRPLAELRVGDAIFKFVPAGAEGFAPYRLDGVMLGGATRRAKGMVDLVGGYQIDRIAADLEKVAPTDLPILLLGESGTGKEVAARAVHAASGRRGAFHAVNCAAIPQNLLESELFGYKRGAFSGADRDKAGIFRAADGGTLLLDEIGDMPHEAQAKLLRALETREIFPVGATSGERVDVRVLAATHRDLVRAQATGAFRGDLYARLDGYRVTLPPLRERKEDVYLLARRLLARMGRDDVELAYPFLLGLLHHAWPYNVRELDTVLRRAVALASSRSLGAAELPDGIKAAMADYATPVAKPEPVDAEDDEPRHGAPTEGELRAMLARHAGNVAAVGRELGKERMQIHRWMRRYGITPDDYR